MQLLVCPLPEPEEIMLRQAITITMDMWISWLEEIVILAYTTTMAMAHFHLYRHSQRTDLTPIKEAQFLLISIMILIWILFGVMKVRIRSGEMMDCQDGHQPDCLW